MRDEERAIARAVSAEPLADDAGLDRTLRPRSFSEVVGQTALLDNLRVFVEAARRRNR